MVNIELEFAGCSNVLVDNSQGMHHLLAHLVDKHKCREIAFVGQRHSPTSDIRLAAFIENLSKLGLYDPALVGDLTELDSRGLSPGIDYEAIIALSDWEASQLVETLRHRGISIPGEVAIASFNDSMDARGCQPPLTSVRLPFRAMGRRAVEMLIPRISGSEQLEKTWMPLQLVLRRSCGCLEPMAEQAAALETFPETKNSVSS